MNENLGLAYLEDSGDSAEEFDGLCVEFCDCLERWAEPQGIALTRVLLDGNLSPWDWLFHSVCVDSDMRVHDHHLQEALHLKDYVNEMFDCPDWVEYEIWDPGTNEFSKPAPISSL